MLTELEINELKKFACETRKNIVKISNVKIRGKEKTLDLYEVIRLIG